jgi:hypothetical protein
MPKEAWFKVIHADEELKNVIFKSRRFSPDYELAPHMHHCHAIAYTISGEWEYEGLTLPVGPRRTSRLPASTHRAASPETS